MCYSERTYNGTESNHDRVEESDNEIRERGRAVSSPSSQDHSPLANRVRFRFAGKYKWTNCETYQEFLDTTTSPTMSYNFYYEEVTDLGGGKWRLVTTRQLTANLFQRTTRNLSSGTNEFEFNKPFDFKETDGRVHWTCTVTMEGDNKWVFNMKKKVAGGPDNRTTWVFTDAGIEKEVEWTTAVINKDFYARQ